MKSFSRPQHLDCINRSFSLSLTLSIPSIHIYLSHGHTYISRKESIEGLKIGLSIFSFAWFIRFMDCGCRTFFSPLSCVYFIIWCWFLCVAVVQCSFLIARCMLFFFVWFRVLLQLLHLNDWFITIVLNWNRINVFEVENWTMTISF